MDTRPYLTPQPMEDYPYAIQRTGTFEAAHLLEGHPKCGKLHGHSYEYVVFIQADGIDDKYGFVIDFSDISKYFDRFDHSGKVLDKSCEEFTEQAATHFKKQLPSHVSAYITVAMRETAKSWAYFSTYHLANVNKSEQVGIKATASLGR